MTQSPPAHLTEGEMEVLRDALTGRPGWFDLARALETAANERSSFGLRLVSMAFVYDFVPQLQGGRRETAGGPYATMSAGPEGSYPPHVPEVREEVRTLWRSVLGDIDDPIACARLADLLYVAEGRSAHADGRRAASCFVGLTAESAWTALDRAECAARALEILAELNDRSSLAATAQRTVGLVDDLLGQEHAGPPLIALRALLALKAKSRPSDLDDLLDRVVAHFENTTHEAGVLGIAADATTDQAAKAALRRRQLEAKVNEAQRGEGIAKVALLTRAIEFARRYGFAADADSMLKELQDMPQSELSLESIEVSTDVPVDEVRREVDRLVGSGATDAIDALGRIGTGVEPPGGSNVDMDAAVDEQNRQSPVQHLFGQTILGGESAAPHFVANEEDDKRRVERGRLRKMYADYLGSVLIGPMLDAVIEHHDRPSHEELTAHFATELIGEIRAERIARSLELFWEQQYDDCAHILVPRLESILRDLARARDATIVKHAGEGSYGGVVSLNVVMSKLRALDPDSDWIDYLEALLCDPLAINLRNLIAHGITPRTGGTAAALLLHAACFLALLRPDDSAGPES